MRPTSYRTASYRARPSAGSRATSTTLSLAILVAIILALLWAGRRQPSEPPRGNPMATFNVTDGQKKAETASRRSVTQPRPQAAERAAPPRETVTAPPPPIPVPVVPGYLRMERADYAATDIGRMPRGAAGPPAETAGGGSGGRTAAGIPGAAPNGETLYPAEWYREPTRAEMATYMPARGASGFGLIMCRTIDRWHVEDCREMAETPGSGISRAMRRASFQFLVRPPMVNGKPQIGTWVRIRFDLIVTGGDAPPDAPVARQRAGVGPTGPTLN